jgi:Zn-dependent protease/CBS domain-containing protein
MLGKRFDLFTMLGFTVRLDASWFLIFLLVTWSLAAGLFPAAYPALATWVYWAMGVAGALGLFAAIVVHELAHSLVARRHGMPMKGITLFMLGGVAEMSGEPPDARTEAKVAIAGPVASVVIAASCLVVAIVLGQVRAAEAVVGVVEYLAEINLVVAIFNLLPAFPLDGGRLLRAALWKVRGSLRWATRIASRIGAGFGAALIILGVVIALLGSIISGIWLLLIGVFLRSIATSSYQQLLLRQALDGEPVKRFMHHDPVTVPASIAVEELIEDYVYRHHHKLFPVVEGGRLVGCISTRQVKELPRDQWLQTTAGELAVGCDSSNSIAPDSDAIKALSRMRRHETTRLLVVAERQHLVGILTMKDLLHFFNVKLDLELDESEAAAGVGV